MVCLKVTNKTKGGARHLKWTAMRYRALSLDKNEKAQVTVANANAKNKINK